MSHERNSAAEQCSPSKIPYFDRSVQGRFHVVQDDNNNDNNNNRASDEDFAIDEDQEGKTGLRHKRALILL